MKFSFKLLVPIILCLSGCSKEISISVSPVTGQGTDGVEITDIVAQFPSTKALLDAGQRVSLWEAGDNVEIISDLSHSTFTLSSGEGTNLGHFSGSASVNPSNPVYAVYPVPETVAGTIATVNINSLQTQTNYLDLNGNDLYYAKFNVGGSSFADMDVMFNPLTSLISVRVEMAQYSSERIDRISMEAPGMELSGKFRLDLSDVEAGFTGVTTADNVIVELPGHPSCAEPFNVNFAVAPCPLKSGSSLRFVVYTDKGTHLFERRINSDFVSGKAYTVKLNAYNESENSVLSVKPSPAVYIARVTGDSEAGDELPNPTNTYTNFSLPATDYGIMWEAGNGKILALFGDNWTDKSFAENWKSNTVGITSNNDLENGIKFEAFVMDGLARKEIIPHTPGDDTFSLIPSAGISLGTRQYVLFSKHIMKPAPADPDEYVSDYSELAYSDDYGNNWTRSGVQWQGSSNFVQGAYLKQNGFVYFYGIPSGRKGDVRLARVPEDLMLEKTAYKYWTGNAWSSDIEQAAPITSGPTGELSVFYNAYYNRYFMMYLSVSRRAIVIRQALSPEGEWSGEQILQEDSGEGLYGPSVHPWGKDGREIYYVTSHAKSFDKSKDFWNVYLMKSRLDVDANGFNMISEGGFEDYPDEALNYRSYWYFADLVAPCRYVAEKSLVHSGKVSLKIENPKDNWISTFQSVAVRPNTDYVLSCWARTRFANSYSMFLCAKTWDNAYELAYRNQELTDTEWRRVELQFNSGSNAIINPFVNTAGWTTEDSQVLYIYIDDVNLRPKYMK